LKEAEVTCVFSGTPLIIITTCDDSTHHFVVTTNEELEVWARSLEHISRVKRVTAKQKSEGRGRRSVSKIIKFAAKKDNESQAISSPLASRLPSSPPPSSPYPSSRPPPIPPLESIVDLLGTLNVRLDEERGKDGTKR